MGIRGAMERKIFCIGLSRTGTRSLRNALEKLGFETQHIDWTSRTLRLESGDLTIDLEAYEDADAFLDLPVACHFRELDQRFPGSRFILTTREIESWLNSCERNFSKAHEDPIFRALRRKAFGAETFDRQQFRAAWERHLRGVEDYFSDRPDDLLILDLESRRKWKDLCTFLGKEEPRAPFPRHPGWKKTMRRRIRWRIRKLAESFSSRHPSS